MSTANNRQIVLDTETTGMNMIGVHYEGHRIIEIGAVEVINRRLTGNNFHMYLKPDRLVDPEAFGVHGIADEFLADKPAFSEIADEFQLREVDRVLIDDGWMIISGFNPFSLLGVSKMVPGLNRKAPWSGRMFSQVRLVDWLGLLNYEVVYRTRFQVLPWHRQGGKLISAHLPALGCLNIVVARKRTFPLLPTRAKKSMSTSKIRQTVNATRQFRQAEDQDSVL